MSSSDLTNPPRDPHDTDPLWDESVPADWRGGGSDELAPALSPRVKCWRCGRDETPVARRCPLCSARLTEDEPPSQSAGLGAPRSSQLLFILLMYGFFLATSVIWGWVILAERDQMTRDDLNTGTALIEGIDTLLVIIAMAGVGRMGLAAVTTRTRIVAWTVAGPALALLIGLNLLYGLVLREFLKPPGFLVPETTQITLFTVALTCVQPAMVEELFFRYLALGVLSRATTMTTAVWVSSVMFAIAHIYNPLGLPYLFLAGVLFGLARVYGGLLLPMTLHFLHNFAVMAIEVAR
jgi:membrane protease YdiL (CAAX protease family)